MVGQRPLTNATQTENRHGDQHNMPFRIKSFLTHFETHSEPHHRHPSTPGRGGPTIPANIICSIRSASQQSRRPPDQCEECQAMTNEFQRTNNMSIGPHLPTLIPRTDIGQQRPATPVPLNTDDEIIISCHNHPGPQPTRIPADQEPNARINNRLCHNGHTITSATATTHIPEAHEVKTPIQNNRDNHIHATFDGGGKDDNCEGAVTNTHVGTHTTTTILTTFALHPDITTAQQTEAAALHSVHNDIPYVKKLCSNSNFEINEIHRSGDSKHTIGYSNDEHRIHAERPTTLVAGDKERQPLLSPHDPPTHYHHTPRPANKYADHMASQASIINKASRSLTLDPVPIHIQEYIRQQRGGTLRTNFTTLKRIIHIETDHPSTPPKHRFTLTTSTLQR